MVGHGHLKYIYIYILLSYFLHFTIGPISVAHPKTTPWPTPVEDHCGHILMVRGPYAYCTGALMVLNILCNEIPGVHLKQGYTLTRCVTN